MKQLILFTGVILLSCVIMSSVVIPANAEQGNGQEVSQSDEVQQENIYVLKNSGGILTVYMKGSSDPILTTDTFVSVLPKDDQKKLEQGIEIEGEKALQQALEDYCS